VSRILLVEDNADLAFGLRNNLEIEGHNVEVSPDGPSGLDRVKETSPDLVILDLMLPKLDGFHVLRLLRECGFAAPILILTARGEETDKVRGLRLGGDDYVTKPFGLMELLARVEALLRRGASHGLVPVDEVFRFGDVELRPGSRTVLKGGRPVDLAPKELDLLLALWHRRGDVVSRNELLRSVWSYSDEAVTRTVDTHVGELRRKLEDEPSAPRYILTVRKSGYRLQP
jgi:two-component system, OmpR family, alkaline phosphatase synthesis response regulator PhoP